MQGLCMWSFFVFSGLSLSRMLLAMAELECLTGLLLLCVCVGEETAPGGGGRLSLDWVCLELDSFPDHHHSSSVQGLEEPG